MYILEIIRAIDFLPQKIALYQEISLRWNQFSIFYQVLNKYINQNFI